MSLRRLHFEDMRVEGFVQKDCAFAGRSLGEYSALASMVTLLFLLGLTRFYLVI